MSGQALGVSGNCHCYQQKWSALRVLIAGFPEIMGRSVLFSGSSDEARSSVTNWLNSNANARQSASPVPLISNVLAEIHTRQARAIRHF
jgi:hypothetical protein